jgi:FkbM family methyltransferase
VIRIVTYVNRGIDSWKRKGTLEFLRTLPTIFHNTAPQISQGILAHIAFRHQYTIQYKGIKLRLDKDILGYEVLSNLKSGRYEEPERRLVEKMEPGLVIELGGGIGFISCYIDNILSPEEHLVVEPNPELHQLLIENRRLNDAGYEIVRQAYAPTGDESHFGKDGSFSGRSLSDSETGLRVTTSSLESLLSRLEADIVTLVIDIEGGEFDLLNAESEILEQHVNQLLIEFHEQSGNVVNARQQLESLGFRLVEDDKNRLLYRVGSGKE